MPNFNHTLLTTSPAELDIISTALGTGGANQYSDKDVGKAMKMNSNGDYVVAADGDEIEGFLDSVRGDTVNGGFSFGGVQRRKRIMAQVGAGQTGSLAIGDTVVADAQVAVGTEGIAQVKAGSPATYVWRVMRVDGDGTTGSKVLLERQ